MKYQVVIPVYNGEDVIEACLGSITEQAGAVLGKDYSVLVVDDGSTDATAEIAARFPVRVIGLGENRGRVVARLTGAREAPAGKVLFIDSRVTVPRDLIARLGQYDSLPAVIMAPRFFENSRQSFFERVFYLIRRKFYGRSVFPVQTEDLIISRDNFKRSPKGTTMLLIDRELFLRLAPERTGKEVNDDTLIFQKLVFAMNKTLLRTQKLDIVYNPKRRPGQTLRWLFERGVRFSDFYFSPGGYLRGYFNLCAAASAALMLLAFVSYIAYPPALPLAFGLLLVCHCALCVYLTEELTDFAVLFVTLPAILITFGAGALARRPRYGTKSSDNQSPVRDP